MRFLRKRDSLLILTALISLPLFFFDLDRAAVLWLRNFYGLNPGVHSFLDSVNPYMNFIFHGTTLLALAFIVLLAGRFLNRRLYDAGKFTVAGFFLGGIAAQIIKHLAGRARPRLTSDTVFIGPSFRGGYDSFPSGHTAVAFCMAGVLSAYFPRYRAIFYLFASAVGVERIEVGAHFPSDVLMGGIVGIVAGRIITTRFVRREAVCRS